MHSKTVNILSLCSFVLEKVQVSLKIPSFEHKISLPIEIYITNKRKCIKHRVFMMSIKTASACNRNLKISLLHFKIRSINLRFQYRIHLKNSHTVQNGKWHRESCNYSCRYLRYGACSLGETNYRCTCRCTHKKLNILDTICETAQPYVSFHDTVTALGAYITLILGMLFTRLYVSVTLIRPNLFPIPVSGYLNLFLVSCRYKCNSMNF